MNDSQEIFQRMAGQNLTFLQSFVDDESFQSILQQAYEAYWQYLEGVQGTLKVFLKPGDAKKLDFCNNTMKTLFSPKSNLEICLKILKQNMETKGQCMIDSMQQFMQDAARSEISDHDRHHFEVGTSLAITPGNVVYQNDLLQLIHYKPTTPKVYETPLLIIPPCINKYYILDLQPHNSMVKWLVDKGYQVFLVSWNNPGADLAHKGFADYVLQGPLEAINFIKRYANRKLNLMSYCIGGTITAALLAYLQGASKDLVNSCTFLTSLIDFSEPGDLGVFIDEVQLAQIDSAMEKVGYFDGKWMKAVFSMLRPQEMIVHPFVNNYLLGKKPKAFDILHWNSDSTRLPHKMHSYYLRNMYLQNNLAKPGALVVDGVALDVTKISVPVYSVSAEKDHITPWRSVFGSMKLLGSKDKTFVLCQSGHVAAIANPPGSGKYGFCAEKMFAESDSQSWIAADRNLIPGSWWVHWDGWLAKLSGEMAQPLQVKECIEPAPGGYVKKA